MSDLFDRFAAPLNAAATAEVTIVHAMSRCNIEGPALLGMVLLHMVEHQPQTQAQIKSAVAWSKDSVSYTIRQMERQGFIVRQGRAADDGRLRRIGLTSSGVTRAQMLAETLGKKEGNMSDEGADPSAEMVDCPACEGMGKIGCRVCRGVGEITAARARDLAREAATPTQETPT